MGRAFQSSTEIAFSADRGLYRVLLGAFPARAEADAFLAKLKASGQDGFVVPGAPVTSAAPATISVTGGAGASLTLPAPVDLYAPAPDVRVVVDGVAYRGSLRILVNPRGTLNVVNRVDLEEYLWGVVPAEMGPKRFDAIEGLKAQAVAARTYAMAHRAQFESEGYDICPGPKCQAYGGASAEDPLSTAAVDGTRGLVLAYQGQFADALFVSTCGGVTENVENVFSGGPLPYLVSVPCGELPTEDLLGARNAPAEPRTALAWRGYVLRRHTPKKAAPRSASLEIGQKWAGVPRHGAAPARLSPSLVYPSLVTDFGLTEARLLHLTPPDERYYAEPPSAVEGLSGSARSAYDFFLRFRFAGDLIPPADRDLDEEEYAGLVFSVALRLMGVTEGSGRFLSREGSNLWVKTADGRQSLPVNPDIPLGRRVGDTFHPAGTLTLRPGDKLRWYRNGAQVLALWVEMEADGPEVRARFGVDGVGPPRAGPRARAAHGRPRRRQRGPGSHRHQAQPDRSRDRDARQDGPGRGDLQTVRFAPGGRNAGNALHGLEGGGRRRPGRVRLPRPRLGPRRRHVPERRLRHGPGRPDVRPDPAPLLHRHRDRSRFHGGGARHAIGSVGRLPCGGR